MAQTDDCFHQFSEFPLEVRLAVWTEACMEPRVIPLLPGEGFLSPVTRDAAPSIIHVCRESRYEGLRHYRLDLHPNVYFHPESDVIMLHVEHPRYRIDPELYRGKPFDLSVVQRLGVLAEEVGAQRHVREEQHSTTPGTHAPADAQDARGGGPMSRVSGPTVGAADFCRHDLRHASGWEPFSNDFLRDLRGLLAGRATAPGRLVLLMLPPFSARPNLASHRIRLAGPSPSRAEAAAAHVFYRRAAEFVVDEQGPNGRGPAEAARWDDVSRRHDMRRCLPDWVPLLTLRFVICDAWGSIRRGRKGLGPHDACSSRNAGGIPEPPDGGRVEPNTRDDHSQRHIGDANCTFYGDQGVGVNAFWQDVPYLGNDFMGSPWSYCGSGSVIGQGGSGQQERTELCIRRHNGIRDADYENW